MMLFCWIFSCLFICCHGMVQQEGRLGPGSFEPSEWAQYPRGVDMLNEIVDTVSKSRGEHERIEVRLGMRDLNFLGPREVEKEQEDFAIDPVHGGREVPLSSLFGYTSEARNRRMKSASSPLKLASFAIEIARRWPHGDVSALFDCETTQIKSLLESNGIRSATLKTEASQQDTSKSEKQNEDLLLVLDANTDNGPHVSYLQALAANLYNSGKTILLLNPKLDIPNPMSPGATMKPFLLSDFVTVYIAQVRTFFGCFCKFHKPQADALDIAAENSGIGIYRRWPHNTYRLYERRANSFSFLGTVRSVFMTFYFDREPRRLRIIHPTLSSKPSTALRPWHTLPNSTRGPTKTLSRTHRSVYGCTALRAYKCALYCTLIYAFIFMSPILSTFKDGHLSLIEN